MIQSPFQPIDPNDWPESIAHLRDDFAGRLNVYKVMAHHPELLASWSDLRRHVVTQNALGLKRLEVVILRVAVRLGSGYEWMHHVQRARDLGMEDARIFSVANTPDKMSDDDAIIVRAVDELIDQTRLERTTLAALEDLVGKAGVLDLMATVGFYKTLGCLVESFAVALDDGIPETPLPNG